MRPRLNGPIASGVWHEYGEPVGHRDHEVPVGFKVPLEWRPEPFSPSPGRSRRRPTSIWS